MLSGRGVLLPIQQVALRVLADVPDQAAFYLTGGTALSEFYLGHRLSFDLDMFTVEAPLVLPFSRQVEQRFAAEGWGVKVARRFQHYVEIVVYKEAGSLRIDFAWDTPHRFAPPVLSAYGIYVNDWDDLVAEKVLAYYGRAEPRDAVDLYFLLEKEPLERLLRLAAEKDCGFDRYWFAIALRQIDSFPDEPERWPVKVLLPWDPRRLKQTFRDIALRMMDEIQGPSRGRCQV